MNNERQLPPQLIPVDPRDPNLNQHAPIALPYNDNMKEPVNCYKPSPVCYIRDTIMTWYNLDNYDPNIHNHPSPSCYRFICDCITAFIM